MDTEFINLDSGNIASEHLCCIIRTQKAHPGVEAKRAWLAARLDEGHVFRKVNAKGCAFIEYAPLETAWAPVVGDNYLYNLLPVGAGRSEGSRLWAAADGILHCRREGAGQVRRVHDGRG